MAPLEDNTRGSGLTSRLSGAFTRPAKSGLLRPLKEPRPPRPARAPAAAARPAAEPVEVLPPGERRRAMSGLDPTEVKWSKAGLIVAALLGAYLTYYLATHHSRSAKVHGHTVQVPISESYLLLGAVVLICCAAGLLGVYRRRRTLVAFAFFITGFAFTLVFAPLGLVLIFGGGWLMLRAYRIQKYGTASAKGVAREAAARPPRRERKATAARPTKPTGHKAPSANKRYTPKAPPRKKVAKPTE